MQILKTVEQARGFVRKLRQNGATVGLVPTMGALHEGHLSLVRMGTSQCDHTIATIFVNPTQFAAGEDLGKYPRTLQADLDGLRSVNAAAVYVPDADQIYPPGFSTAVQPPQVSRTLEGEFRPTHFQGVATVVLKLFNILPATHAFFGQKDYQQLRVIQDMVRDLDVEIEVVACPIIRDPDGMAMSSRNRYLSEAERSRGLRLSQALAAAQDLFQGGERSVKTLENVLHESLLADGPENGVDSIDYATVVDATTLAPIERIDNDAVALIAARVGQTRLIDNRLLCHTHSQPASL